MTNKISKRLREIQLHQPMPINSLKHAMKDSTEIDKGFLERMYGEVADSADYMAAGSMPENLTKEQQIVYKQLSTISQNRNSGFTSAAIEIFCKNPKLLAEYTKLHRKSTIEKIALALSPASDGLLSISPDKLECVLNLEQKDLVYLMQAHQVIRQSGLKITDREIQEAINAAKIMSVMEEDLDPNHDEAKQMVGQYPKGHKI